MFRSGALPPYLQVDAVVLHDSLSQGGDVDPSVALSSQVELILAVLWEEPEELLQRQIVVHGHLPMDNVESLEQLHRKIISLIKPSLFFWSHSNNNDHSPLCHWLYTSYHQSRKSRPLQVTPGTACWQSKNKTSVRQMRKSENEFNFIDYKWDHVFKGMNGEERQNKPTMFHE